MERLKAEGNRIIQIHSNQWLLVRYRPFRETLHSSSEAAKRAALHEDGIPLEKWTEAPSQYIRVIGEDCRLGATIDDWGECCYLWEVDETGWNIRHMEIYANGNVLSYDLVHTDDQNGGLCDQNMNSEVIDDPDFPEESIKKEEFEMEWDTRKPINR